ncbi:MAG: lipoyl synthase [Firmicutes bacterium]|nr:lipoyl synthase [Bacillota bacterium]
MEREPARLPSWLRVRSPLGEATGRVREVLKKYHLNTVCQSAACPNAGQCFAEGTATFMILGRECTRDCRFCAVRPGQPGPPNPTEPERVAAAARELGLRHVVVTSVTRDDLPDGGAGHFAATITAIREAVPEATVEVLTPDFGGDPKAVAAVVAAGPDVYNHNLETVPRLYPIVRPGADYRRSLALLRRVKELQPAMRTKSGLMVGLGETEEEILAVLADLRAAGCEMLTIGQYLRPSRDHLPVAEYVPPERFAAWAEEARAMGFSYAAAGPLVRSSYHAGEAMGLKRYATRSGTD